jgi:CheY-like chemotaxis protein
VEAETLVRVVASEMLFEEGGFHVYEARDGQEALVILELRGDSVRALVSDISMPHLSGLDLAAIVKGRWPHLGIVLASAYPPADLRERMPKGALFLEKPYKGVDLLKAVQSCLERRGSLLVQPCAFITSPCSMPDRCTAHAGSGFSDECIGGSEVGEFRKGSDHRNRRPPAPA